MTRTPRAQRLPVGTRVTAGQTTLVRTDLAGNAPWHVAGGPTQQRWAHWRIDELIYCGATITLPSGTTTQRQPAMRQGERFSTTVAPPSSTAPDQVTAPDWLQQLTAARWPTAGLIWEDPPTGGRRAHCPQTPVGGTIPLPPWTEGLRIARLLRRRPGRWALIYVGDSASASRLRTGISRYFFGFVGPYESTSTAHPAGTAVYVRSLQAVSPNETGLPAANREAVTQALEPSSDIGEQPEPGNGGLLFHGRSVSPGRQPRKASGENVDHQER